MIHARQAGKVVLSLLFSTLLYFTSVDAALAQQVASLSADQVPSELTAAGATNDATISASTAPALHASVATTITVDTVADLTPSSNTTTCTFTGSGGLKPAEDGKCTLRRAIIQANGLPQAMRPVTINFNLPGSEENASVAGTWTIEVIRGLPAITTVSAFTDRASQVTIDGSTQPGGRTDGPSVFISTGFSLSIERAQNVVRNLGFFGGGTIQLKRLSSSDRDVQNIVENIWMGLSLDGQSIVIQDEDNPRSLAGGGIVVSQSDNSIIRNNVVAGASGRAIKIDGGNGNTVANNSIGTRGDGTVPTVDASKLCVRSFLLDPTNWYGGWGIQLSGDNNIVQLNRIAGLHQLQSPNDTPPIAIELTGKNNRIEQNVIGVDQEMKIVGVCGAAITAASTTISTSGDSIKILKNLIVQSRKGFEEEESDSAIYISGSSGVTVQENIVLDSTKRVVGFTTTVASVWKNFQPAKITNIAGTSVSGHSGLNSPCPNCIIELFLDDYDEKEESFELVGTAIADANGNWSTTITKTVPTDRGLRTTSTTQDVNVIGTLDKGTSTKLSGLQVPPNTVQLTGNVSGTVGVAVPFLAQVISTQATTPMTFTIEATDLEEPVVTVKNETSHGFTLTWFTTGTKQVTVTAENCLGEATSETFMLEVTSDEKKTFLPYIER